MKQAGGSELPKHHSSSEESIPFSPLLKESNRLIVLNGIPQDAQSTLLVILRDMEAIELATVVKLSLTPLQAICGNRDQCPHTPNDHKTSQKLAAGSEAAQPDMKLDAGLGLGSILRFTYHPAADC